MAESQTGFDARQYKLDQLNISAPVMPDTWFGHAKLAIEERDMDERQKAKVLRHTRNIAEKRDLPTEAITEKVIEKLG